MAHVAARLKKQKDDEVTKERERIETSRIYAEYVRTFDVSGAPAAPAPAPTLQFVRSGDSAARSSHETGQKQTVAGVFDLQGEDDADDSVDEHRAEYLKSVVPTAPTTSTRPASTGKTREIDAFIQELKEKQQRQEAEKALKRRLQCVSVTPSSQDGGRYGGAGDSSPRSSAACTLHVDNLSPEITQGDLDRYFGAYGRVDRIRTLRSNTPDRRAATFAFVTFSYASDAALAKEALHGADIMGYRCKIVWVQQHGDRSPPQAPSTGPLCGDVVDFFAPSAAPKLPRLPVDSRGITVEVPQSPVKRAVIDLTARYVAEGGSDLEAMIMANETPDGLLGFLFGPSSPEHVYYRWKVYSLLQGDVRDWRKEPFRVVEDGVLWHPPLDCGGSVADVSASAPGAPGGAVFETSISLSHSGHARLLDSDLARLQDLLRNSSTKRSSVAEAMLFIITHGECAFQVTDCLVKSIMEDTPTVDKKISRLYILSDVLYNTSSSNPFAWLYRTSFEHRIPEVFAHIRGFMKKSTSKIAVQQLMDCVTRMLPAWHQWNAYPPEYLCGLESALWGADFDSFTALPIFEENLDALDPTYDGDEIEHYDVLCKFPLRWREAAYRYLQMRLKKLRQLCVSRGLVTDPGTRSALVTRLIINDMYVEARAMEARDNSSESTHVEPDEMEAALSDPTQYVEESATLAGNPLHATDATGSSYTIQAVAGDVVYDECSDMESESDREAADLKEVPVEVEAVAAESCEKAIEAVAVTVSEVEDADAGTVEVMSVSDVAADASPPPSEPEVVTEEDDIEDMFAAEN